MSNEQKPDIWHPTRLLGHSDIVPIRVDHVRWMPPQLPSGLDLNISQLRKAVELLGLKPDITIELIGKRGNDQYNQTPSFGSGLSGGGTVEIAIPLGGTDEDVEEDNEDDDDDDDEDDPDRNQDHKKRAEANEYVCAIFIDGKAIEHATREARGSNKHDIQAHLLDKQIKKGLVEVKKKAILADANDLSTELIFSTVLVVLIAFNIQSIREITSIEGVVNYLIHHGLLFVLFSAVSRVYFSRKRPDERFEREFWKLLCIRGVNIFVLIEYAIDFIHVQKMKRSMTFSRRHRE